MGMEFELLLCSTENGFMLKNKRGAVYLGNEKSVVQDMACEHWELTAYYLIISWKPGQEVQDLPQLEVIKGLKTHNIVFMTQQNGTNGLCFYYDTEHRLAVLKGEICDDYSNQVCDAHCPDRPCHTDTKRQALCGYHAIL
jgi:hypothetical protein